MVIAVVLLLLVVGSIWFHLVTPWWLTPLASDWHQMDQTLHITVVVTTVFFVVINLFIVFTVWRFRHRDGSKADYQPANARLERWLVGITTVGIVALLAPGLAVYANYVSPPGDAMQIEVVARQWQWHFRLPGADGKFGGSDVRFVSGANPLGLDPADASGQDDLVVTANEIHLPLGKPVKVLARSHDVLHDFFVPEFRARMNIVPGQVSWFWFTPTKAGRYEAMCAQLCGVGHPRMQGYVVVEDEAAFAKWRMTQTTFAQTQAPAAGGSGGGAGRALAQAKGCLGCHSLDGAAGVGPSWKGLFGKTETMVDGSTAKVDDEYLRAFIRDPKARAVKGFAPVMPVIELSADELDALVAFIKSQS